VIRGATEASEWRGQSLVRERISLQVLAPSPLDLIVFAAGFRTRELSGVFADTTVRLEHVPRLSLRLASPLEGLPPGTEPQLMVFQDLPTEHRSPQVRMLRDGGYIGTTGLDRLVGLQRDAAGLPPDGSGEFSLDARTGGSARLRLRLLRRVEGRTRSEYVDLSPASVDLDATRSDAPIELEVNATSLQQAVQRLRSEDAPSRVRS
jgi:hypothetical protein